MTDKKVTGEPSNTYGDWRKEKPEEYRKALVGLSEFKRRFVEAYLEVGCATEAARMAGSKAKRLHQVGWNTLNDEAVQIAIALGLNVKIQAAGLSNTEVINNYRNIFQSAMDDAKYAEANKATEGLAKILGLFGGNSRQADNEIQKKAKELRETPEVDNAANNMLSILGKAKTREGTQEDPRNTQDILGPAEEEGLGG